MRSQSFIIRSKRRPAVRGNRPLLVAALWATAFCVLPASAQRVAILTPDNSDSSLKFAEKLSNSLAPLIKVLDLDLAAAAFNANPPENAFNMSADESKRSASAIGSEFILVMRSATQRRSSFGRPDYFESSAPIYVVSGRTGQLALWKLLKFEGKTASESENKLFAQTEKTSAEITEAVRRAYRTELDSSPVSLMEEVPEPDSPAAKNFRAPIPYRRMRPEYTAEAAYFDITATVDIEVDLDEKGTILRTSILRWAGYGLDESVEKTVREMNWRPAERNGRHIPMRFLLRYNFKKLEKE